MADPTNPTLVLKPPSPHAIRDELTVMVIKDLLGPAGGPEEELDYREDRVRERYLVGMLAPKGTAVEASTMDNISTTEPDDVEVGPTDIAAPPTDSFFPSSMGMSFVVEDGTEAILIKTEWGCYQRIESQSQLKPDGNPRRAWKRSAVTGQPQKLPMRDGNFGPLAPSPDYPRIVIQGRIRHSANGWVITVFLVNSQEEPGRRKDEAWIFQPKMQVVDAGDPSKPIFVQRRNRKVDPTRQDSLTRQENQALDMLYRFEHEFAIGHGVSVLATLPPTDPERAVMVETDFVPLAEVAQQTPPSEQDNPDLAGLVLDMKVLAEMPKADLVNSLRVMEKAYGQWIDRQAAQMGQPAEKLAEHQAAANGAIGYCRRVCQRIREGIDLIDSDPVAERSFRFANQAMWHQRIHTTFTRKVRKKELTAEQGTASLDVPQNRSWRLFQLAFVILNLPSVTRLDHPDRSHETNAVADLLWFATGGGKTEAYLGLTAYTLAMRRLQGDIEGHQGDHGVAVLMRYTLRLLTIQQFQRAASLLCACEVIRRGDTNKWGIVPFRLGLWVGKKATPNTLAQAAEFLRQSRVGGQPSVTGTPCQVITCPWCGTEIRQANIKVYEAPSDIGRCVTYCGDALGRCEFSEAKAPREGLPIMVVDEEIYRRPPSLLIATVDKFAQMPWRGETQMLFGKVNGLCSRHGFLSPEIDDSERHPERGNQPASRNVPHGPLRPPDLIIQDELHLISGPLGSMVGLFETAVDELCSWQVNGKKVRPKVIASTATIRRALDQVQKLFVRKLEVFPPQGTNIQDSFFAIQRQPGENYPGRRYMGICAFGRRYPAALIRVYIAYLAAAQSLYEKYDNLADPWMTLTGYFNSIRELAGTRRLVEDDIRSRLRDIDQRGLAKRKLRYGAVEELTSRKSGSDIPRILERLEIGFDKTQEAQREEARKAGQKTDFPRPYDVILATNMISVGVDIERLGLMVVAGQPKNTSEYIQATSRVGRSKQGPGLICTLFNWARPRDLSHYEAFERYHRTFYQHVEALSVTPFSARALDRGLSGVLVSMMRLFEERLNANIKAGELQDVDPLMQQVFQALLNRGENSTDDPSVRELMEKMLNKLRDFWLSRIHNATDYRLGYREESQSVVGLLEQAGMGDWKLFTCLNSLRDVEGTVNLILDSNPAGLRLPL